MGSGSGAPPKRRRRYPIFAADQVTVTSGRSVHGDTWLCIVFTLPNAARTFPTLASKPPGSAGERHEPFLEIDAFLAKRQEEIGARVRVDDRLERRFGLAHLERVLGCTAFVPAAPRKLPMTAMSGIEDLRRRRGRAVHRKRAGSARPRLRRPAAPSPSARPGEAPQAKAECLARAFRVARREHQQVGTRLRRS